MQYFSPYDVNNSEARTGFCAYLGYYRTERYFLGNQEHFCCNTEHVVYFFHKQSKFLLKSSFKIVPFLLHISHYQIEFTSVFLDEMQITKPCRNHQLCSFTEINYRKMPGLTFFEISNSAHQNFDITYYSIKTQVM